jgi:hypothetical protein
MVGGVPKPRFELFFSPPFGGVGVKILGSQGGDRLGVFFK